MLVLNYLTFSTSISYIKSVSNISKANIIFNVILIDKAEIMRHLEAISVKNPMYFYISITPR